MTADYEIKVGDVVAWKRGRWSGKPWTGIVKEIGQVGKHTVLVVRDVLKPNGQAHPEARVNVALLVDQEGA